MDFFTFTKWIFKRKLNFFCAVFVVTKWFLWGESHINFCMYSEIMTQKTWPPSLCCLRHFQIFDKIDGFQKTFWMYLGYKKTNCFFEELSNLYLIVLLISLFPLLLWIAVENRTKLKKLFIWATKSGGTQHHKHANCTWLLFIGNCSNISNILDWTWFLHYFWLQEVIQQQT